MTITLQLSCALDPYAQLRQLGDVGGDAVGLIR
jgi:hypothetical protein